MQGEWYGDEWESKREVVYKMKVQIQILIGSEEPVISTSIVLNIKEEYSKDGLRGGVQMLQ